MKRLRLKSALAVTTVLALAVVAWAFYATTGTGSGSGGTTGSLTAATISVPDASSGTHAVTFDTQATLSNSGQNSNIKYTVQRKLGSGSFANVPSGPCSGQLSHGTASCNDTPGAHGTYTYRVIASFSGWTATSNEDSVTVTLAVVPAAPTTVALANGGGVGDAYINDANQGSLSVNVGLPASSTAGNVVGVTVTDGSTTTTEKTTTANGGAETVTVTGIDASGLTDGSVTIRATSSNGSGTSPQTTTSVTRDTVKPTSAAGTVANITSGNTFTVPYTSGDAAPSSSLQKVDLYVETPDAGTDYALEETDTSPTASGENFSYDGATLDGAYSFYTQATDNAGNVEDAPGGADATATRTSAAPFRMATGSYVGNAADNRTIAGLGFQPDVVIVKGTGQISVMRTATMPSSGNNTKALTGNTALATGIRSLTSDGFTLSTNAQVNGNSTTYHWMAFDAADDVMEVGTYTGNGSSSRSISGLGFQPEYVAVLPANNGPALQRFAGMSAGYLFAGNGAANRITALDSDGFSVGTDGNASGAAHHWIALNEVAGAIETGVYEGDNTTSSQAITDVGFQPDYVLVRGAGNVNAIHRPASLAGTSSFLFNAATNPAGGITALTSTGFDVGNDSAVNANNDYYYLALKNTAGGSSRFSTLSGATAGDSWVNQASASANLGNDSVLKVTSKSGSSNTRALVRFNLPAIPAGMSVKHSSLYLNNTSTGASGRTIQAFRAAATWAENTVNWTNQPSPTGIAATALTTSSTGFLEWNVGSLVSAMYPTASNNFGFLLRDQTENDSGGKEQQFSSEEAGSNIPRLDVTFGD